MNIKLIINYIKRMNKNDVKNIAFNKGIFLSDKEVDNVYYYVKNNYNNFLIGKVGVDDILSEAKKGLSQENYEKFIAIYNQYKDKI